MDPLPPRTGQRPRTTSQIPHSQRDQQPSDSRFLDALLAAAVAWPGVRTGRSGISVEGARALYLAEHAGTGPADAFMVDREFCHGHAQGDHSLHLTLPIPLVDEAESAGWIEPHLLVRTGLLPRTHVMLYASRNDAEVVIAHQLVRASYEFAAGSIANRRPVPERRGRSWLST